MLDSKMQEVGYTLCKCWESANRPIPDVVTRRSCMALLACPLFLGTSKLDTIF
jgi:hypothetical protein